MTVYRIIAAGLRSQAPYLTATELRAVAHQISELADSAPERLRKDLRDASDEARQWAEFAAKNDEEE